MSVGRCSPWQYDQQKVFACNPSKWSLRIFSLAAPCSELEERWGLHANVAYISIYRCVCVYKEHLHICRSSTVHSWEPLLLTFSLRKFTYAQPSQLRLVHKHPSTLHGCPVLPLPKPAAPKLRRAGSRSECIHEAWKGMVHWWVSPNHRWGLTD